MNKNTSSILQLSAQTKINSRVWLVMDRNLVLRVSFFSYNHLIPFRYLLPSRRLPLVVNKVDASLRASLACPPNLTPEK